MPDPLSLARGAHACRVARRRGRRLLPAEVSRPRACRSWAAGEARAGDHVSVGGGGATEARVVVERRRERVISCGGRQALGRAMPSKLPLGPYPMVAAERQLAVMR